MPERSCIRDTAWHDWICLGCNDRSISSSIAKDKCIASAETLISTISKSNTVSEST